jgi:hypothetical protein
MLKDRDRWEIHFLRRRGDSIQHIREITHHDRKTIRNVLAAAPNGSSSSDQAAKLRRSRRTMLEPFKEFLLGRIKQGLCTGKLLLELRRQGFSGSLRSLQRFLHARKARTTVSTQEMKEWMHLVSQGAKTSSQIKQDVGDTLTGNDVATLLEYVRFKPLKLRNRALALLAYGNGITAGHIASFLCITQPTARQYISSFIEGGIHCVLDLSHKGVSH